MQITQFSNKQQPILARVDVCLLIVSKRLIADRCVVAPDRVGQLVQGVGGVGRYAAGLVVGPPKNPMSSMTMSLLAARKLTAFMKSRLVLKLANRSWAPGAISWTISSIAVPSAPVPPPRPPSRLPSARKEVEITPPEVDTSLPAPSLVRLETGMSPEAIACARPGDAVGDDAHRNPGAVHPESGPQGVEPQERVPLRQPGAYVRVAVVRGSYGRYVSERGELRKGG